MLSTNEETPYLWILGARGLVGEELLRIIDQEWKGSLSIKLSGGDRSSGERVSCKGQNLLVEPLQLATTPSNAFAVNALPSTVSKEWTIKLLSEGISVIDLSGHFSLAERAQLSTEVFPLTTKNKEGLFCLPQASAHLKCPRHRCI